MFRWLLLTYLVVSAIAQFRIFKKDKRFTFPPRADMESDAPFGMLVDMDIVNKLMESEPSLTEKQAFDVAYLIDMIRQDPESMLLLTEIQFGTGKKGYEDYVGWMTPKDIAQRLAVAIEEVKILDKLFQDPAETFLAMEKEGMLDEFMIETYRKNPALLEEDTRKTVFYIFVTLGAAGGYL